ncbi:MAG: serine/threonine-protein kinase [Gallionella sp.]|nr:serine/threonine-protein kinase [Gallionella sp.]
MDLPYRLGKYELDKMIGVGSTGKVYHALDTFSGREVAVKLIDEAVLHDAGFNETCRAQFRNEAALAGRLAHPHVVAILEASVTPDSGYIVMEYVPGGSLVRHTYHDNLLPVVDVLQIIYKCCSALEYAFNQGIVHRDIKPGNIMLVSGTNVKITDFGSSVFYKEQITQAVTSGTPSYMSLEHIKGQSLTYLSDMYSLGVVAYELLTGRRPFEADTLIELLYNISVKQAVPPSALRGGIPAELDKVILKMIARNPEDRYPNWTALKSEIAKLGRLGMSGQDIADSEKFCILRAMHELGEFPDPEIWELVHASKWHKLPAAAIALREDEPGRSMYILASGTMRVTKQGRLLNTIKGGEFFGEMAYILRGTNRQATLETTSDATVAELTFDALEKLSTSCELRFVKSLLRSMTNRLVVADLNIVRMYG